MPDDLFDAQLDAGPSAPVAPSTTDEVAVIEVRRRPEWAGGFGSYEIVIDDCVAALLGTSSHALCHVQPGCHTLSAKRKGWKGCRTQVLTVWLEADERAVFEVGVRSEVILAWHRSPFGILVGCRRMMPWWPPGSFVKLERFYEYEDAEAEHLE